MGSLMYAMLCARQDIYFFIGIISRYQSNLGFELWVNVKHILKYLWRIREHMPMSLCVELVLLVSVIRLSV